MSIGVDDLGMAKNGFHGFIVCVDMDMAVKKIARLESFDQPAECLISAVDVGVLIMDPKRGTVGDHHVQIAAVDQLLPEQSGDHAQDKTPHLGLGIQERAFFVGQRTFETCEDGIVQNHQSVVEVDPPPGSVQRSAFTVLHPGIVIAPHIQHRNLIELEKFFDVVVGQVAAGQDQVDILE